jgi:hypothetical protein
VAQPPTLDSPEIPLLAGPYAGLYYVNDASGSPFVRYALTFDKATAGEMVRVYEAHAQLTRDNAALRQFLRDLDRSERTEQRTTLEHSLALRLGNLLSAASKEGE